MTEKKISETVFSQPFDPLSYWIEQDQANGDFFGPARDWSSALIALNARFWDALCRTMN